MLGSNLKILIMNKCFIRIIVFLLISYLLTDCATKSASNDFYKYEVNNNGLIIGTVTFPKNVQWFDKYFFRLRDIVENKSVEFTINSYETVNDPAPENNYTKKYVFIIEKKPGNYEINNLRLFADNHDAEGKTYFGSVKDFSIPINVAKGEITYIGDIFCLEDLQNKSIYFKITDAYEHDIRYFKSKSSLVNWNKLNKSIIQPIK